MKNIGPRQREKAKQLALENLRREIAKGTEQAERGEFVDGEAVFARILEKSQRRRRELGRKPTSS